MGFPGTYFYNRFIRRINISCLGSSFFMTTMFILVFQVVLGQRFSFEVFNSSDGMPGNQVNDLLQDRFGRLWVATMNGVAIFDGADFTTFDRMEPVSTNPVKTVFEDSKGNIWIGMNSQGVGMFNGIEFIYYNESDEFTSGNVNSITEDLRGHLWFATSEGIFRFDGKKFHGYSEIRGISNNNVFSVMCDSEGSIWASTINGISEIRLPDIFKYDTNNGLSSNITYHISEDTEGKLWIGTYLGITTYDNSIFRKLHEYPEIATERIEKIVHEESGDVLFASYGGGVGILRKDTIEFLTVAEGLPSNIVKDILKDREGNYWFGTWNGLCRYQGSRFTTYTIEDGLNNNNLLSIDSDSKGRIWFGTLTGGLNYFEKNKISSIGQEQGLISSTIWSIYTDSGPNHWFGTTVGPVKLHTPTMKLSSPYPELNMIIYAILRNSEGRIMFGTDKGIFVPRKFRDGFDVIDAGNGLLNDKVRVLYEDKNGIVWIGTMDGVFYLKNDSIKDFNDEFGLPGAPITSITEDPDGRILISTYDYGVFIYDPKTGERTVLDVNSGLFSNKILFNLIDNEQNLWIGTSAGLDFIRWQDYLGIGELKLIHFDKSNGFTGVETNAACLDDEGNIWFATVNGAIKYDRKAGISESVLPIVRLNKIQLFMEYVDWRNKPLEMDERSGLPVNMVLGYDNNHINFSFQGIYLSQPDELKYEFMLEGFDEDWSPSSSQTFANYSNLAAGNYTFKVRASVNEKDWSNALTYSFSIKPPYWKTPFFYFLYVATITGSIILFFKIRTRSLRRTQAMLRQKVEQRTQELNDKNLELEKLSIAASETDNAVLIFDENRNIEWVNSGYTRMTGYTVDQIIADQGSKVSDFTFNEEADRITTESIESKKSSVFESRIPCSDGRMIWTSCTLTPIFDDNGQLKKIVLINTDITLRKQMEEQIRESLEEKGMLLKEIHHRVKNNLQIIISLFNLQTHYIEDEGSLDALKEGQERIKSMALIHERFYQSDGLSKIDFDDYIRRLSENLYLSFDISPEQVKLVLDVEKISLDIDTAVPCGLIINELVSNALKHGFKGRDHGELRISFSTIDDGRIRLNVSDDGVGLPYGFDYETSDSLGIQLMKALTSQLEGTMTLDQSNGTSFILEFKSSIHHPEKQDA